MKQYALTKEKFVKEGGKSKTFDTMLAKYLEAKSLGTLDKLWQISMTNLTFLTFQDENSDCSDVDGTVARPKVTHQNITPNKSATKFVWDDTGDNLYDFVEFITDENGVVEVFDFQIKCKVFDPVMSKFLKLKIIEFM